MACIKQIRSDLAPSFPAGGIWTYVGFASTDSGPFTETPSVALVPFPQGSVLTAEGDNFNIDSTGVSEGYYKFNYTYVGSTVSLIIKVEQGNVGADVAVSYDISDDGPYDLNDLITTTDLTGTWTDVDGAGEDEEAFVPSNLSAGVYRYTYSLIDSGYENKGCADCDLETTVTITISESFSASVSITNTACNYSMTLEEPKVGTANTMLLSVSSGVERVFGQIDRVVASSCGVPDDQATVNLYSTVIQNTVTSAEAFVDGATMTTLTLANAAGGTVVIPLAPGTATLTGSYGTTTATALTFSTLNPGVFGNAVKVAAYNYLIDEGYTIDEDVDLYGVTFDADNYMTVTMGVKHNPTGDWLGLGKGVAVLSYISGTPEVEAVTSSNWVMTGGAFSATIDYPLGSCGTLSLTFTAAASVVVDDATSDFDTIALTGGSYVVTPSTTPVACTSKTLAVNAHNCSGTLSYLWNTGQTSSSIVVLPGMYSVNVTCSTDGTIPINVDAT